MIPLTLSGRDIVDRMIMSGYRRVSRAYGIVSRIDTPAWIEIMANGHPSGLEWVEALGGSAASDYYRRVLSKDKLTVGKDVANHMPSSSFSSPQDYIEAWHTNEEFVAYLKRTKFLVEDSEHMNED